MSRSELGGACAPAHRSFIEGVHGRYNPTINQAKVERVCVPSRSNTERCRVLLTILRSIKIFTRTELEVRTTSGVSHPRQDLEEPEVSQP